MHTPGGCWEAEIRAALWAENRPPTPRRKSSLIPATPRQFIRFNLQPIAVCFLLFFIVIVRGASESEGTLRYFERARTLPNLDAHIDLLRD